MSKISSELMDQALKNIFDFAQGKKVTIAGKEVKGKKRKFLESIELQVTLKNHDPKKDKRFSGTFQLAEAPRPNQKICVLGNEVHSMAAREAGIPALTVEDLKKFNKNKKELKRKLVAKYDAFIASSTLLKQIPRLMGGPILQRAGKFPTMCAPAEDVVAKCETVKQTIKWQMKKVIVLNLAVANVGQTPEAAKVNIVAALNFLVSLLKKNWQNIKVVYIKSTMGPAQCIFY